MSTLFCGIQKLSAECLVKGYQVTKGAGGVKMKKNCYIFDSI